MTDEPIKKRPLYQKILLPFLGLCLFAIGIVGFVLPFLPGWIFVAISIPLICCVDPRAEAWADRKAKEIREALKNKLKKS